MSFKAAVRNITIVSFLVAFIPYSKTVTFDIIGC